MRMSGRVRESVRSFEKDEKVREKERQGETGEKARGERECVCVSRPLRLRK